MVTVSQVTEQRMGGARTESGVVPGSVAGVVRISTLGCFNNRTGLPEGPERWRRQNRRVCGCGYKELVSW